MTTLFIIDAYNLIYRMFYAIPEMHTRDGTPVNAIFGVAKFLKWLSDENPDALLVVANDVGKSFRADMFVEYKAQRDRMPDNLRSQIDGVFELFRSANILVLSQEGYEADDIIGTLAVTCQIEHRQIVIISSDKDLCQFVDDGCVHIYDAMKRKFMKRSDVIEKFGVPPEQVRDYLAIVGDSSDNIPGIAGFGPKKAVDLLSKYHTLEGIYDHLRDLTPKMQEVLVQERDNAFLSQGLATIVTDLSLEEIPTSPFAPWLQRQEYQDLLRGYEFRSLLPKNTPEVAIPKKDIPTHTLRTLSELGALISRIEKEWLTVSIATDTFGKIFFWIWENVYVVDSHQVDVGDFIQFLLSEDRKLVGYSLKTDIKRLMIMQKPAEVAGIDAGQGRLF